MDIKNGNFEVNGMNKYRTGFDYPGPHQGNFVNNGLVTADRAWSPELTNVKYVYQYVKFLSFDAETKQLTIKNNYDYIIIDCQPSLGICTMNALVASNSVIIPVQCEFFALEGITQLLNSIIMVQSNMNPELKIEGVLLTMLDGRTNIGLEVIEEVRKYFRNKVFNTIIPRLVRLVEAPSHGKPISDYDPTSRATEAYQNLAKEVISRNGE
jgi:cellulose biosynthesis protein BcsQ